MRKGIIAAALVVLSLAVGCQAEPAEAAKKAKKNKPNLTVSYSKVKLVNVKMQAGENGSMKYQAAVKNTATKGTIKKIEYTYSIQVKQLAPAVETGQVIETLVPKTVKLVAKNIKPGKTSKIVNCEGDASGNVAAMKLQTVRLYAGTGLYTYDATTGKGTVSWGTKDKKAPVISGLVGKKSYYQGDIRWTCYTDQKKNYDFAKFVTVTDNRDSKVKLHVDSSKINWEKEGIYKVHYFATDKAGNKATAWAKVQVLTPGTAEQVADSVLKSIIGKGWSAEKKARAIYKYVQGRCSYVDNGTHGDWRKSALNGIRYQSGDCFTYYSVARILLTRAGVPNIMVTRYPSYEGYRHWWSLVYVRGGWYHLDTTPRKQKEDFCLLTDGQVWGFSTSTFRFQTARYIKRATKKISPSPKPKK